MITAPTLFVLGAGSSMPYGFPSARGLLEQVARSLMKEGDRKIIAAMGLSQVDEIESFERDLLESGLNSVDEFLEHRPEFLDIGRAMIALSIVRAEKKCNFFRPFHPGLPERDDNPYNHLLNALWSPAEMSVSAGQARFISFNYDRSLEQYLALAVRARRGCSYEEAIEDVERLHIVHVYGSLGSLCETGGEHYCRGFGATWNSPEANLYSANSLSLIGDHRDDDPGAMPTNPELSRARDLVAASRLIVFLGFGYDRRNLARIRPAAQPPGQLVFGTACKKERKERQDIEARLEAWSSAVTSEGQLFKPQVVLCQENLHSELFMRRHLLLSN